MANKQSSGNNLMKDLVGPAAAAGPTGGVDAVVGQVVALDVDLLDANPYQPREDYDDGALKELMRGLQQDGQLQDVGVRMHPESPGRYQIIYGHRRTEAFRRLREAARGSNDDEVRRFSFIRAQVRPNVGDVEMARWALKENWDRAELNCVEAANGLLNILKVTGKTTAKEAADVAGLSVDRATMLLRVARAPAAVKKAASTGIFVVLQDSTSEGDEAKERRERRRLDLTATVEFCKLYEFLFAKDPKRAETRTENAMHRALGDGWTLRRIQGFVADVRAGKAKAEVADATEPQAPLSAFKRDAKQVVIFPGRFTGLSGEQRAETAKVLRELLAQVEAVAP